MATIIPSSSVSGHTVPTVQLPTWRQVDMLLFVGIANTLAIDFLVRKKVGLHMTFSIVDTLPIPAVSLRDGIETEIVRRAGSL
jgi:hypothetical protein